MTSRRNAGRSLPASLDRVIVAAAGASGRNPLSDQSLADLRDGRGVVVVTPERSESPVAFAYAAQRDNVWTMQLVVAPTALTTEGLVEDLVERCVESIDSAGGGQINWWVFDVTSDADARAADTGFDHSRDLFQMRRTLPVRWHASVATRAFVPGVDDEAWLAANNRAFAAHPEQGGWTVDDLQRRLAEPWFDASGFRLHEIDGRLAAFCWTKIHEPPTGDPADAVGEIYVIGVDPDFQRRRLGRELTLAGLDSISTRGISNGLLYVDGANDAAVGLYRSLGFETARHDRAYVRPATLSV